VVSPPVSPEEIAGDLIIKAAAVIKGYRGHDYWEDAVRAALLSDRTETAKKIAGLERELAITEDALRATSADLDGQLKLLSAAEAAVARLREEAKQTTFRGGIEAAATEVARLMGEEYDFLQHADFLASELPQRIRALPLPTPSPQIID